MTWTRPARSTRTSSTPSEASTARPAGEGTLVAENPTCGAAELCLVADGPIEDVVARLDDRGIDVVEGPVDRDGAQGPMTSVYFRDPEGNLVEVATYSG